MFRILKVQVKSAYEPSGPSGFYNMNPPGVLLLPFGWNASPSMGNPQHHVRRYPFIYLGRERHCDSVLARNTTQCPRSGLDPGPLDPETSALTIRPPHLLIIQHYQVSSGF